MAATLMQIVAVAGKGEPSAAVAHYLKDGTAPMALAGVSEVAQGVDCVVEGSVEANAGVGPPDVVVDCRWDANKSEGFIIAFLVGKADKVHPLK